MKTAFIMHRDGSPVSPVFAYITISSICMIIWRLLSRASVFWLGLHKEVGGCRGGGGGPGRKGECLNAGFEYPMCVWPRWVQLRRHVRFIGHPRIPDWRKHRGSFRLCIRAPNSCSGSQKVKRRQHWQLKGSWRHVKISQPPPPQKKVLSSGPIFDGSVYFRQVCARSDVIFCACDLKPKEKGGGGRVKKDPYLFFFFQWQSGYGR